MTVRPSARHRGRVRVDGPTVGRRRTTGRRDGSYPSAARDHQSTQEGGTPCVFESEPYNVQNRFSRARVIDAPSFSKKTRAILEDIEELSVLLARPRHSRRGCAQIQALLEKYDVAQA